MLASGGPFRAEAPPAVNLNEVLAGLADDNVHAPEGDVDAFRDIVSQAADEGIDLKIVAFPYNPWYGGGPRDLANDIGAADGGTVLVLGPNVIGTYSDSISRFALEGAQIEIARREHAEAAAIFLEQIAAPGFPWTGVTFSLLFIVAAVIVFTRWWTRRGYDFEADGAVGPAPESVSDGRRSGSSSSGAPEAAGSDTTTSSRN